eukprot:scaffold104841_cov63-Phaeocystis_antarctica.AAC.2
MPRGRLLTRLGCRGNPRRSPHCLLRSYLRSHPRLLRSLRRHPRRNLPRLLGCRQPHRLCCRLLAHACRLRLALQLLLGHPTPRPALQQLPGALSLMTIKDCSQRFGKQRRLCLLGKQCSSCGSRTQFYYAAFGGKQGLHGVAWPNMPLMSVAFATSPQDLRRGVAASPNSGIDPDAAEPMNHVEVNHVAGDVQRCFPPVIGGVEGGTRAVQPLGDVKVTPRTGVVQRCISPDIGGVEGGAHVVQPLSDVEVTPHTGVVQWCTSVGGGGVEGGAHAVQPLSDMEVTFQAGEVQRCLSHVVSDDERGAHAVQPLGDMEVTITAGEEQRCNSNMTSNVAGGIERGTRAVQPLSDFEVALRARDAQLGHPCRQPTRAQCGRAHLVDNDGSATELAIIVIAAFG